MSNAADTSAVFATLDQGMRLKVTVKAPTGKTTREVSVTGVQRDSEGRLTHVWTTSGRTRPGHVSGGALTLWFGDVKFQATPQQKIGSVYAIEVIGSVN